MLFTVIYLTNAFIINPKLDNFCFLMATTLISIKLLATFWQTNKKDPGILKIQKEDSLTYKEILESVPQ